jgi:hypothetical protein
MFSDLPEGLVGDEGQSVSENSQSAAANAATRSHDQNQTERGRDQKPSHKRGKPNLKVQIFPKAGSTFANQLSLVMQRWFGTVSFRRVDGTRMLFAAGKHVC